MDKKITRQLIIHSSKKLVRATSYILKKAKMLAVISTAITFLKEVQGI